MSRYDVDYLAPYQIQHTTKTIGHRALEMLGVLLQGGRFSRLRMLKEGRPRVALNAPSLISGLRKKGFTFRKHRVRTRDANGEPLTYIEYQLLGTVGNIAKK